MYAHYIQVDLKSLLNVWVNTGMLYFHRHCHSGILQKKFSVFAAAQRALLVTKSQFNLLINLAYRYNFRPFMMTFIMTPIALSRSSQAWAGRSRSQVLAAEVRGCTRVQVTDPSRCTHLLSPPMVFPLVVSSVISLYRVCRRCVFCRFRRFRRCSVT